MFEFIKSRAAANKVNPTQAWASTPAGPRRRSIVREFALNTSTHGLPGMARSRSKFNLAFWTVSFLIFLGVATFFIVQAIQNYFQYPTQTSVSIVRDDTAAFPAVSICNYAPIRFDLMIASFFNYTNRENLTNTTDPTEFGGREAQFLYDFMIDRVNANLSVTEYYFSLNITLIECTYNRRNCTASDFRSFLSAAYGLCHTFNAKLTGQSDRPLRTIYDDSAEGKLRLRLYANSHLYPPYLLEGQS